MIDGARRVGKSWITEEFAKNEYRTHITINFSKIDKDLKVYNVEDIASLEKTLEALK